MDYKKINKNINIIGIFIWIILYVLLVPFKLIKKYPLILLGFFYVIFILTANQLLIGKHKTRSEEEIEFTYTNIKEVNSRAIQVASVAFAIAISIKGLFPKALLKEIILFLMLTLLFGAAIIIPIYFISNQKDNEEIYIRNQFLARLRNISLAYSLGFLVATITIVLIHTI